MSSLNVDSSPALSLSHTSAICIGKPGQLHKLTNMDLPFLLLTFPAISHSEGKWVRNFRMKFIKPNSLRAKHMT